MIIDTDGGVDDAAALWWAVTDPSIELICVTAVSGVVSAEDAAANVLRVLSSAGRADIPVAIGASAPIGPTPKLGSVRLIHGDDGLGNTTRPLPPGLHPISTPADQLLDRMCAERPDEISIVSLGPLTNLAMAIARRRAWPRRVRQLVAMAGSARSGGNALPAAEANVARDPTAAAIVVEAEWETPPLMVGLDVTHVATLTEREFALLAEHRTPAAAFLDEPLHFYRKVGSSFTGNGCPCHDLLALLAFAEPGIIVDAPTLPLAVNTAPGPAWGSTVVDFRGFARATAKNSDEDFPEGFHPWKIALDADVARFRSLLGRMFGGN